MASNSTSRLAIHGGAPVRSTPWPAWPQWDEREREALLGVLESGRWWATEGDRVAAFETAFADFSGVRHCIAVTNGTHAIEVALLGLGIGEGDEVIVTDYSFFASAAAVVAVNAVPVLVDIDPHTFCIDPTAVAAAITPRTRAVVAVHIAGHPCDLDALGTLCTQRGIALVEDCAHAHGSQWNGRPVGSLGDAGTFSFQQSKLLTAGEGGAITVREDAPAADIRSFADCGRRPGEWFYRHFVLGGNFRLSEWQGAMLLAQLQRFPAQHARRNENALVLNEALRGIPGVVPQARDQRTTSQGYYCYLVRIDEAAFGLPRDVVREALVAEGIPMTMSYPEIHALDAFTDPAGFAPRQRGRYVRPDYAAQALPVTREMASTTLWCRHSLLMGSRDDALALGDALAKIHTHRDELRSRA